MSTSRLGPGRLAEEAVEDRARDVVRQVRDDVVGRSDELGQVLVERVALDERQAAGARSASASSLGAGTAARPRSSSTAVTCAPASSRPAGQERRARARSRGRAGPGAARPRRGSPRGPRGRPGSSATSSERARRPGGSERPPDGRGVDPRRCGHCASSRDGDLGAGQRQRRPGVEVEPGALAGREASGRRPRRSSPRCRCTDPGRGTTQRQAQAGGALGETRPERPVRGDAAAEHDRPRIDGLGRADRLRREDVDDRVLEAPRELGRRRRRTAAPSGSSGRRPSSARAASTVRRAAVLRPEKLKS